MEFGILADFFGTELNEKEGKKSKSINWQQTLSEEGCLQHTSKFCGPIYIYA
jgi:hypothetical protein